MLSGKENVVRIYLYVGANNPIFDNCKEYKETSKGACEVVEAIEWEFEQEKQAAEFEKMRKKGFSFRITDYSSTLGYEIQAEYVTRTSYYE